MQIMYTSVVLGIDVILDVLVHENPEALRHVNGIPDGGQRSARPRAEHAAPTVLLVGHQMAPEGMLGASSVHHTNATWLLSCWLLGACP